MKIYIVTKHSGQQSWICSVYETDAGAQAAKSYLEMYNSKYSYYVTEYDVRNTAETLKIIQEQTAYRLRHKFDDC